MRSIQSMEEKYRFHLEGKYENELLLLFPVAVKTELQRQHISKELIEYGFERTKGQGCKAVIVEGNPMSGSAGTGMPSCVSLNGIH